jgi:hypothetical protein
MKLAVFVLLLLPTIAAAQFKCVDAAGRITIQQTACPMEQKQQPLKMRADIPSPPASVEQGAGVSVHERMLRNMVGERRVLELSRAVQSLEFDISNRNAQMSREFDALRVMKTSANNNLAGATYQQSLSTEMQAVAAKYKALNDTDQERLKLLRADLASAKLALGKAP